MKIRFTELTPGTVNLFETQSTCPKPVRVKTRNIISVLTPGTVCLVRDFNESRLGSAISDFIPGCRIYRPIHICAHVSMQFPDTTLPAFPKDWLSLADGTTETSQLKPREYK